MNREAHQIAMNPPACFQFCPRCGVKRSTRTDLSPLRCEACDFLYYFNPAVAGAAIILDDQGRALLIRRAKEPSKGKLGLAGGFIDVGETAEEGVRREVREEVNLELEPLQFLCSFPNHYFYQEVTYPVLDLFFVARARERHRAQALDAVESFDWYDVSQVSPEEMAFPSMQKAWALFQETQHRFL